MNRYIDIDYFFRQFPELNTEPYNNVSVAFTQEDIDNIQELAYISGQQHPEKPKGEWITYSDYPGRLKCPNCNHRYDAWFIDNGDFCPNCGSDNGGDV